MSTTTEGKVGQNLDGFLLMLNDRLDQILDGKNANDLAIIVQQGQMADVLGQHLLHTSVDGIVRGGRDEVGALGGNFLDEGFLGLPAEEGHLVDVVALRDYTRDVTWGIWAKR